MCLHDNRYNKYIGQKKSARLAARSPCQLHQGLQAFSSQVSQLLVVDLLDRFIESRQQCKSFVRNSSQHHPPILGFTAARRESSFFQPVQQSCDVRIPRNHAVPNFTAGKSLRRSTQNAQDVILRRRQLFGFQQLSVVRSNSRKADSSAEPTRRFASDWLFSFIEQIHINRYNDYCQHKYLTKATTQARLRKAQYQPGAL
jgi:hypothetical protein